jgi:hypothetical protein
MTSPAWRTPVTTADGTTTTTGDVSLHQKAKCKLQWSMVRCNPKEYPGRYDVALVTQIALESFDFQTQRFWIWVCVGYVIFLVRLPLQTPALCMPNSRTVTRLQEEALCTSVILLCACAVHNPDGSQCCGAASAEPGACKGDSSWSIKATKFVENAPVQRRYILTRTDIVCPAGADNCSRADCNRGT